MAESSTLAQLLCRLLDSLGWTTEASRFTVRATEPTFEPVTRTWLVGKASALTEEEVREVQPSRIIVEDFATSAQLERLRSIAPDIEGHPTRVWTYTAFADELWDASRAQARAIADAEDEDPDALFGEEKSLNARHIDQFVDFGTHSVADHRALDSGLPGEGTWLAILADAGLGKSEFLRLHEYRYAQMYASARRISPHVKLPPIAIRVSLRDFRSLSFDYIAHALSQPIQRGSAVPLPRISSGALLRELLIQGRLILFLDGLDEVQADSAAIDSGLSEWHRVVSAGGRLVVASRTGHASSRGAIARRFRVDETASMLPLERPAALELLERRGASGERALAIYGALAGPAASIPLYLVLANHVGLDEALPAQVRVSKTLVLETLVRLFCEREVPRLGVDSDTQMELLDQVAEWLTVETSVSANDLLQAFGLDAVDVRARVVLSPHAMLQLDADGNVRFKFAEFHPLFVARSLASSWQEVGFNSVVGALRSKKLDEVVVEYLARLIHSASISGAWIESAIDSDRSRLLRRNLLAIALAKVNDVAAGAPPNARAAELASILGNRALINVDLSGLTLDRFDFAEWTFRKLQGLQGLLAYCENLHKTDHDETVQSLVLEGCSFSNPESADDFTSAVDTLVRIVRPMRRKTNGTLITLMSVDEVRDPLAWTALQKAGLATRIGKAKGSKWELTSNGTRLLTSFNAAQLKGPSSLDDLIASDAEIRALLRAIAAIR